MRHFDSVFAPRSTLSRNARHGAVQFWQLQNAPQCDVMRLIETATFSFNHFEDIPINLDFSQVWHKRVSFQQSAPTLHQWQLLLQGVFQSERSKNSGRRCVSALAPSAARGLGLGGRAAQMSEAGSPFLCGGGLRRDRHGHSWAVRPTNFALEPPHSSLQGWHGGSSLRMITSPSAASVPSASRPSRTSMRLARSAVSMARRTASQTTTKSRASSGETRPEAAACATHATATTMSSGRLI